MNFSVKEKPNENKIPYKGNQFIKLIEDKLNDDLNNYCVECGNENPEYISINNGVFICIECIPNHLKFPKNISRILKNDKNSLTLNEIQCLLCGGNKALLDFINNEYPKLSELPPNILYRTQAMVYYRQHLQYLIKGGIPPIKPSVKYAYKISNFLNNIHENYNSLVTENELYNTITDERRFINKMDYMNNFENNIKFFNSGYNFNSINNNNDNNDDNKFIKTICDGDNNHYDNYFINKPRQINFQNNNNIIIGNLNNNITNNNNNVMYSPKKIKFDFNRKEKKNARNQTSYSPMNENISHFNDIYIKPKLLLSPKSNKKYNSNKKELNQRNGSADLVKKNTYRPLMNDFCDNIISINLDSSKRNNDFKNYNETKIDIDYNLKSSRIRSTLNDKSYIKNKAIKFIKTNEFSHKSFSQKMIKNDNSSTSSKFIFPIKTENNLVQPQIKPYKDLPFKKNLTNNSTLNKKKQLIIDSNQILSLNRKGLLNNNITFSCNDLISNLKNNEKSLISETLNFSEVESFPIKINLKKNKKAKVNTEGNKRRLVENIYFSSDKIKNDPKKNFKKNIVKHDSKYKIEVKQKENKKQEVNTDKRNNIKTKRFGGIKNRSHENNIKESKNEQKKFNGENKNNNKGEKKISIRNKYKQKSKVK